MVGGVLHATCIMSANAVSSPQIFRSMQCSHLSASVGWCFVFHVHHNNSSSNNTAKKTFGPLLFSSFMAYVHAAVAYKFGRENCTRLVLMDTNP